MIELNFPNSVTSITHLFDREAELADIRKTLQSSARRPVVIIGERVMGKTSLLNVAAEGLTTPEGVTTVLHLPHAYMRDSLAAEIMQGICAEVGRSLRQTGLLNSQGQFSLVAMREFVEVAKQLLALQPQRRFLLCLDEFDSLLANCDDLAAEQILNFVLHLIEKTNLPLQFLYTMTQITDQILRSYASPFLNSAKLIPLKLWNLDESRRFVNWLLQERLTVDETCQRIIFTAAGGHPYLTKAILQSLLNQNKQRLVNAEISFELVQSAIEASIHLPELDFTLSNISQVHISPEEMQLLDKIASTPNGRLSREQLLHLGDVYVGAAQKLLEGGYLDIDDHQNYFPRLGLLMKWLEHKGFISKHISVVGVPLLEPTSNVLAAPDPPTLVIDDREERVYLGKREIRLSRLLYRALRCLSQNAGQLVKRDTLLVEAWPEVERADGITEAMLDQVIRRLRDKLSDNASQPTYLETRHGVGYILHHTIYIPVNDQ